MYFDRHLGKSTSLDLAVGLTRLDLVYNRDIGRPYVCYKSIRRPTWLLLGGTSLRELTTESQPSRSVHGHITDF